ncbi:synaptonemal complex protein 1 [Aulostomus maculatus]
METDRGFNFKLMVPPRVTTNKISAVRPREIAENCGGFMNTSQRGYSKCFDKEQNGSLPNINVVTPAKPTRQDFNKMKVPPMEKEENNFPPGQLYSKLFDEVDKLKCWKVKVDADTLQNERKLQENIRTIETQRKAIQDLQFGNESLSIKLEEQISENEDLRSKNNATRNLCNILKDTFHWSADKMQIFESEREETHQFLRENNETIQKMISEFESLRIQAEADQQELKKDQKCEHLKSSKIENDSLLQKLLSMEQHCKETEANQQAIASKLKESHEEYAEIIQSKEISLQELSNQHKEKLEQFQTTIQDLKNSLAVEIQRTKEYEDKLIEHNKELEMRNALLGETIEKCAEKGGQIRILEDELDNKSKSMESMKVKVDVLEIRVEQLNAELSRKNKDAQVLKVRVQELEEHLFSEMKKTEEYTFQIEQQKNDVTHQKAKYEELLSNFNEVQSEKKIIEELLESGSSMNEEKAAELQREMQRLEYENQGLRDEVNSIKTKVQERYEGTETLQNKMEENNKMLKKQMAKEIVKSSQLESKIKSLHEESQKIKTLNEENHQNLLKDLEVKTSFVAELENEVQKLRLSAEEAIKSKDGAELKCQHKTADMVALMEKHKSQYERLVEEKDAELDEKKKQERKADAHTKSLELEITKQKTETCQLKNQLMTEITKKENLQREMTNLKKEISSLKLIQLPEESSKQEILNEDLTTPGRITNRVAGKSKIKSYRIKTPPSAEKAACWGKTAVEFEPKSDSSDQNDILTFANTPVPRFSAPHSKPNFLKKSPASLKSPGNSLKLAAMKRMRDAGWTAVTGCDKKKKKTNEKIFA